MTEILQRGADGEEDLDSVADRAEAYATGIEIIDVSGGISHAEHFANLRYTSMPAAGYLALHREMPPFNQEF